MRMVSRATFLPFFAWIVLAGSAQALTFTVNSTTDAVDANPGNGVCATAAGQCTLSAAIQEANASHGADTISLPAGTYTLTIAGRNEDAAATGDLDIDDSSSNSTLTINGAGAATTIIAMGNGTDGKGLDRVFHIMSNAAISGVTIRNGHVLDMGGGIYNTSNLTSGGSLTLTNVVITANSADNDGGGIQN